MERRRNYTYPVTATLKARGTIKWTNFIVNPERDDGARVKARFDIDLPGLAVYTAMDGYKLVEQLLVTCLSEV